MPNEIRSALTTAAQREDHIAGLGHPLRPGRGDDGGGVDVEYDEIAVFVGAGDRALLGPAIGERHQRGAVAEVVGIGQHLAGGDHQAAATTVLADGDDGVP